MEDRLTRQEHKGRIAPVHSTPIAAHPLPWPQHRSQELGVSVQLCLPSLGLLGTAGSVLGPLRTLHHPLGGDKWKWAPGFRHPVPAHRPSLPHTPDSCCLSCLAWALHPSSKARILGFHTPNPSLGLPQQPLQKPAVLKALAPGEPGGRRCRVGRGRGRAGIPSHPDTFHTVAMLWLPRQLVLAASKPLIG